MKKGSTQSTLLTCLLLSGTAAIVSSCQDYDPSGEQHVQDVAYTHEFERQFGEIDPNQNWDLFGQLARRKAPHTRADQYVEQIQIEPLGSSSYIYLTEDEIDEYANVLPDSKVWGSALTDPSQSNLGKVKQDFVGTAHTFTLAPVYWFTGAKRGVDKVGIYWYTDDETKADVTIMGADGELYWLVRKELITGKNNLVYITRPGGTEHTIPEGTTDDIVTCGAGHVFDRLNAYNLVSHPIQVTVPEEIPYFGFYITGVYGTRYSESKLNAPIYKFPNVRPCYVATFNIKQDIDPTSSDNRQYLCFEDNCAEWETDFDLNDLVFAVTGFDEGSIIDRSAANEKAVLVCEDLTQFDFDFNDVALGLSYTEELNREYKRNTSNGVYDLIRTDTIVKLEVTPMAAGGAYESTVLLNGETWGEIHTLLNESPTATDAKKHQIINASPIYVDRKAQTKTFDKGQLPKKKVGEGENQYPTYLSQLFATGFFAITTTDGNASTVITSNGFQGKENGKASAPQMILLPDYFEWPQEQMYIKEAYAGFKDWVEDVTKTDWILTSQKEDMITDRGDLTPEVAPEAPTEVLKNFPLNPDHNRDFQYDPRTTYTNCVYLDLTEIQAQSYDDASAKLHIVYTTKPNAQIYLDDKNGNELLKDNFSSGSNIYNTYTLSKANFQQALTSGGIWIFALDDREIVIKSADIDITNVTTEAHHKLFVNPTYMIFETSAEQTIEAYSETKGKITFTSTDNSIVTVNEDGVVTPHANGYASILVRAEASTVDGKDYKATSERVSIEVRIGN